MEMVMDGDGGGRSKQWSDWLNGTKTGSGRCDGAGEEDRDTDENGANDGNAEQRQKWKQSASNGQAIGRATDSNE